MEKGSLFIVLSNDVEAKELNWKKRVNIIKEVAHALSYLHHNCIPTIVHRDMTTNNILLNLELQAFVANFGITRILSPNSSNLTTLAGTYGYIVPCEYFVSIGTNSNSIKKTIDKSMIICSNFS